MRVNLITNTESIGLAQDISILRGLLQDLSIEVCVINSFSTAVDTRGQGADLSIFLESLHRGDVYLHYAKANWLIPNNEWYHPHLWDRYLPLISLVLCKTEECYSVWMCRIDKERCLYTGFESRDMLQPNLEKLPRFLHVCGKSEAKGTDAIAQAWRGLPVPLTVITYARTQAESQVTWQLSNLFNGNGNVKHLHNVSDEEMMYQLSTAQFVILPSRYEGYGHALNEALSAKCVVLTTDAPPMNEVQGIEPRMLIPVMRKERRMLADWNFVTAAGIREVVGRAISLSPHAVLSIGSRARNQWEFRRQAFRHAFTQTINRWESYI